MIKKTLTRQDYRLTDSKGRTIDLIISDKHLEIAKVDGHKNNFTFMSTKSRKTVERWQGVVKLLNEALKLASDVVGNNTCDQIISANKKLKRKHVKG